ncbi:MAG: spermidine synthase [Planctomycetota bacterium]|jgi:hypothetical protein
MAWYLLAMLMGSFLLFLVQPLIGKVILPWFGGTPSVWTTCMLFFQLLLLVGYAYAHGLSRRVAPRHQAWVHALVLGAVAALLPITPSASWKPEGGADPTLNILLLLLVSVGGPYLMVSSTAPLLQSWYGLAYRGRSPYRLYALSNVGSMLGLFAYPLVVERLMRVSDQTVGWSWGYVAFAAVCAASGFHMRRRVAPGTDSANHESGVTSVAEGEWVGETGRCLPGAPTRWDIALWLALSACGSVMLLATTNQVCQDVASIPFLWVAPLSLYLLTFIICFDRERWYVQGVYAYALIASLGLVLALALRGSVFPLWAQIGGYSLVLWVSCMVCHGELVGLKPQPRYLTLFYMVIALGGALGGCLVALAAPLVFDAYHEFQVGVGACCVLMLVMRRYGRARRRAPVVWRPTWRVTAVVLGLVCALGVMRVAFQGQVASGGAVDVIDAERNFYGALQISRHGVGTTHGDFLVMKHGNTIHGRQYESAELRSEPTSYFIRPSGVGLAMEKHPRRYTTDAPMRIGIVGLGVGTLASYGRDGDQYRFYEIDPNVISMAEEHFTYLSDARDRGVKIDLLEGDARIVLERELNGPSPDRFDVFVVDAFSSDSIPIHLLTSECMEIYSRRLAADGVIAVHVSNRHINLAPVVREWARRADMPARYVVYDLKRVTAPAPPGADTSYWILMSRNETFWADPAIAAALSDWPAYDGAPVRWTDDFSSLIPLLR